ncbi:MAG: hypothetical protein GY753_08430 [Gammaproteobacteria bacterium]|nr:hypothetical protein [Gammaproteobacteria bacterium]
MPRNTKLAKEQYDRYRRAADNGHRDFVAKAKRNDDFFLGLQWEEKVRRTLERQKKPVMTINKVLATINTVMGEQLKNRADVTFRPFRNGVEPTAEALAKVWMQISNQQDLDALESEMFDDGIITSRGFLDLRMSFDDHMMGEVELALLNPKDVVVDPDAKHYDPDTWSEVFITRWLYPGEIARQYNKADAKILKSKSTSDFEYSYDSIDTRDDTYGGEEREDERDEFRDKKKVRVIERQFRVVNTVPHFVDPVRGDMRVVPQNWDDNRVDQTLQLYGWELVDRTTEQIHWRVTADDVVLHNKVSPYKHFTPIPYFPYFRRGKTMGLVENLVSAQEILNKVSSQELHVLNSSANGGWKIKKGSLQNMDADELEDRGAQTGLVMELTEVGDAEKITPNQIPTGLDRVTFKTDEYIKEISGVSDSARGMDRADVAAKAIQAKQAAGGVNLAKPFDNLHKSRKILARNVLDLIQSYYTEERVLQITGSAPGAESEEVTVNQTTPEGEVINDLTVGEYSVVITAVPTRDSYMESQLEEAVKLREIGVQIPDEYLLENSNLSKKGEMLQSMRDEGQREMQQRQAEAEVRKLELENEEKEVEIQRKQAETQLAASRAQKTQIDGQVALQGDQGGNPELEMAQAQEEMQIERQKLQMEMMVEKQRLVLDRERMMMELELKREMQAQEMLLKQAEAEDKAELAEQQQAHQQKLAAKQASRPNAS